jgi:hypothetical protein
MPQIKCPFRAFYAPYGINQLGNGIVLSVYFKGSTGRENGKKRAFLTQ